MASTAKISSESSFGGVRMFRRREPYLRNLPIQLDLKATLSKSFQVTKQVSLVNHHKWLHKLRIHYVTAVDGYHYGSKRDPQKKTLYRHEFNGIP